MPKSVDRGKGFGPYSHPCDRTSPCRLGFVTGAAAVHRAVKYLFLAFSKGLYSIDMRIASSWKDYECVDATDGERLERWGEILLIRPDPQVVWSTGRRSPLWGKAHAHYHRSSSGGGPVEQLRPTPDVWSIGYAAAVFHLKPMGFKHTGLFPEQSVNWDFCGDLIRQAGRPLKLLNLFAYTGRRNGHERACRGAGHPCGRIEGYGTMGEG